MSFHRLGLLGGMSWQSTAVYYRLLNEGVAAQVGGHASAPVTIHSVDFGEIEQYQRAGDWAAQGRILAAAAAGLERSGVEAIALGTNTLHLVSDQITDAISVPFIDLIDVVAAAVQSYDSVGLLATGYTMTSDMYPKRLAGFGTGVLVPDEADRDTVHDSHLPRTRARRGDRRVARRLSRRDGPPRRSGCAGDPAGVHRDRPARRAGRRVRPRP